MRCANPTGVVRSPHSELRIDARGLPQLSQDLSPAASRRVLVRFCARPSPNHKTFMVRCSGITVGHLA